jgi:hypothetical protein
MSQFHHHTPDACKRTNAEVYAMMHKEQPMTHVAHRDAFGTEYNEDEYAEILQAQEDNDRINFPAIDLDDISGRGTVTYTTTARSPYWERTYTYDNARSAFAAAFYYRWDQRASVAASDGRVISHGDQFTTPDQMTKGEKFARDNAHSDYYAKYIHTSPENLPGLLHKTETHRSS